MLFCCCAWAAGASILQHKYVGEVTTFKRTPQAERVTDKSHGTYMKSPGTGVQSQETGMLSHDDEQRRGSQVTIQSPGGHVTMIAI